MSEQIGEFNGVPVIRVSKVSGPKSFIDPCPLCGEKHSHGNGRGWNDKPAEYERAMHKGVSQLSHRVAHCSGSNSGGYYIVYTTETEGLVWTDHGFKPD